MSDTELFIEIISIIRNNDEMESEQLFELVKDKLKITIRTDNIELLKHCFRCVRDSLTEDKIYKNWITGICSNRKSQW